MKITDRRSTSELAAKLSVAIRDFDSEKRHERVAKVSRVHMRENESGGSVILVNIEETETWRSWGPVSFCFCL